MTTIQGKNVRYYVYKGGIFVLAICSTNLSRRQSGGTLATLVRGAGRARRFKPTTNEETLTFEGLLTIDTPANFQMFDFEVGSFYQSRIIYDDLLGNTVQLDGETLVTGIDDNNGASDFSTWSVTMVRNGVWARSGTGSADDSAPVVYIARATGPHTVRVTFSEGVIPTSVGWTVKINGVSSTVTAVSGGGTIWDFTTTNAMAPGDVLLLNYNAVTGNTLDLTGNEMATLVDFPIENTILTPATFTGYCRAYNNNPYTFIIGGTDSPETEVSGSFPSGGPMAFNISSFNDNRWVAMIEPFTEPEKTTWFNTAFNNGTFPDSVFRPPFLHFGFRYYLTRNRTSFDDSQPLTAS
jgi:hypothetical protein